MGPLRADEIERARKRLGNELPEDRIDFLAAWPALVESGQASRTSFGLTLAHTGNASQQFQAALTEAANEAAKETWG